MLVANIRMNSFNKRKGQLDIQTWHGTGPKKSEKDSIAVLDKVYIDCAITVSYTHLDVYKRQA